MLLSSWLGVFIVVGLYVLLLSSIFGTAYILRKAIDKVSEKNLQAHKDSIEILDNIETNDTCCGVDEILKILEQNDIDLKYNVIEKYRKC